MLLAAWLLVSLVDGFSIGLSSVTGDMLVNGSGVPNRISDSVRDDIFSVARKKTYLLAPPRTLQDLPLIQHK